MLLSIYDYGKGSCTNYVTLLGGGYGKRDNPYKFFGRPIQKNVAKGGERGSKIQF